MRQFIGRNVFARSLRKPFGAAEVTKPFFNIYYKGFATNIFGQDAPSDHVQSLLKIKDSFVIGFGDKPMPSAWKIAKIVKEEKKDPSDTMVFEGHGGSFGGQFFMDNNPLLETFEVVQKSNPSIKNFMAISCHNGFLGSDLIKRFNEKKLNLITGTAIITIGKAKDKIRILKAGKIVEFVNGEKKPS